MVLFQRKVYFSKGSELGGGVQMLKSIETEINCDFPGGGGGGGPTFSREGGGGVQMLNSIETNITCDFPGGGGGPDPLSSSGSVHDIITNQCLCYSRVRKEMEKQNSRTIPGLFSRTQFFPNFV